MNNEHEKVSISNASIAPDSSNNSDKNLNASQQCGRRCSRHSGACYLDFGHSGPHKCSYDQHEFD